MSAIKKQGPAFYADAVAVILGIAGTIVMSVCHTMDTANPLNSFGKLVAFAVLAMVLVCASIAAANRKKDVVSLLAVMCAIALLTLNIGEIISSRILLISGSVLLELPEYDRLARVLCLDCLHCLLCGGDSGIDRGCFPEEP